MSYNLGTNIGAVENGNPTGQVYSTKIVRTSRSIGTCGNTGAISQYGCIFSRLNNNNYNGYATFNIVSPFALGTKPKHLTINKVEILTSQLTFKSTPVSVGLLIIPNTPSGGYDQNGNTLNTDNTKKLAFKVSDSFVQFNSTYVCSNTDINQVVVDLSSSGIENDILTLNLCLINLNATSISLTDGAVFNVSLEYSFE